MTTLDTADRVAGRYERAAYQRHERDLLEGVDRDLSYDAKRADHAVTFIERYLRHSKGQWAGLQFELAPWQRFIVRSLFGWRTSDGLRRFRRAYIEVPRKNGKSTLAAAIALYLLIADGEPGAEVYSAATTREQARIVYDAAHEMLTQSPALLKYVTPQKTLIKGKRFGGHFKAVSSAAKNLDGLNAHGIVIDELHAHRSREVYDVLETSVGARRQPMMLMTTTAGFFEPEKIGYQQHVAAQQLLSGNLFDDETFAFIAAIDEGDDWHLESTWRKANPNYGVTVQPKELARLAVEARSTPSFQNTFRRLHLNEWTSQEVRWLDMDTWDASAGVARSQDPIVAELQARECWAGLDLASVRDLTALLLAFPNDDGSVEVLARFYCPQRGIVERSRRDKVPYLEWSQQGWLTTTPGDSVDTDFIRADVARLAEHYKIKRITYDRWGMPTLSVQLVSDGYKMAPIAQSISALNGGTQELERLLVDGKLRHGGNPILRWMASHVTTEEDGRGYIKPDKKASTERIDGIVALVMALHGVIDGRARKRKWISQGW